MSEAIQKKGYGSEERKQTQKREKHKKIAFCTSDSLPLLTSEVALNWGIA